MESSPQDVFGKAEMEIDTDKPSCSHRQSGCMIPITSYQDDITKNESLHYRIFKILIIGTSGSGKSTAGNILLGQEHFQVSSNDNPFSSETVTSMIGKTDRKDKHLLVLDTPDICSAVFNKDDIKREVERWQNMCPEPHLILFTIRYSPADLQDAVSKFTRYKSLWEEDFIRQRLVVLFTFGDEKAPGEDNFKKNAGLQEILDYAGHRYVIFDNTLSVSEQEKRVDQVLHYLNELNFADRKTVFKGQEKDEHSVFPRELGLKVLIIGKTGNGKSTVGNSILNKIVFPVTTGLASSCTKKEIRSDCRQGINITVIETPDVSNFSLEDKAADDEIKSWSQFDPDLILLAIRCDVRYTPEEHEIYKQIKRVLGEQYVCSRLAVAFTFRDRLNTDIENELKSVYPELQEVLTDTRRQYIVFGNGDQEDHREKHLRDIFHFVSKKGHNINVLIIGKTGNGKSTVGNSLLNNPAFTVTSGLASSTTRPETKSARRYGVNITVTDTPDVSNMPIDDNDADKEIQSWRTFQPDVILLTIRCDVRYTREEFQIYEQIKKVLRDDYLCPRLTVAFTFGDRLDRDIGEELKGVCTELQQVLKDADDRYLVFREEDEGENKRKHIVHLTTFVPSLAEIKKILLLGPPKSGKSSGGDTIVGRPVFKAGTETVRTASYSTEVNGTWCQIFDTPGISSAFEEQLSSLLEVTRPGPHAIFYFVRESVATTEDLELFKRFRGFIRESLRQHVILVVTMDVDSASSLPNHKRVKDTEYISYEMSEEAKGGKAIWLIETLTLEQKKKIFVDHIKRLFAAT